jgi:hypothetical protein
MSVELKAEAYIYVRLSSTNISTMALFDGNSYRMSGLIRLPVCIPDIFLASGLIVRVDDIPKTISLPYKPMTPSSANFTGRRDYLVKLGAYFSVELDEPLRRKSFLLYGMGGIGKTQICLKFTEENLDM